MESDEKLKTGYSGATSMVASEASVIWSTFNGMVNANAFLIGLIGAGLKFFPQIRWGAVSIAGIIICAAWFLTLKRQFAYFSYWISWVRSIEQRALAPEIQTLALGRQYGQGAEVEIPGIGPMQASWSARVFKVQWLAGSIIALFAAVYATILWLAITLP